MSAESGKLSQPRLLRRAAAFTAVLLAAAAMAYLFRHYHGEPKYLHAPREEFIALFQPPPAPDSPQTRLELDQLLNLQTARSPQDVEAARADRRTEVSRFATALELDEKTLNDLPLLQDWAQAVEDDERGYVRAAKEHFRRLRPYEIEPAMKPCIAGVRGDLSYPSGHATYAWTFAYLLADMLPEKRTALLERAAQYSRQRILCGVHFASDIEAGRLAGHWLAQRFLANPDYREEAARVAVELRATLPR